MTELSQLLGPLPRTLQPAADAELALYTFWLAVFTGALVLVSAVQSFFLLRADKTARTAANAARDSVELARREFLVNARPRLQVRQVAKGEDNERNSVEFVTTNTGGSRAHIVESRVTVIVRAKGTALPLRPFNNVEDNIGTCTIAAGEARCFEWRDADGLELAIADVMKRETNLFVLGYHLYSDDAGVSRRTAFCRLYDADSGRFRTLEDPDYEYSD